MCSVTVECCCWLWCGVGSYGDNVAIDVSKHWDNTVCFDLWSGGAPCSWQEVATPGVV